MSDLTKSLTLPNDRPNLHLLAIQQRYYSLRRSSEGNHHISPCQAVYKFHSNLDSPMEEGGSADRNRSLSLMPRNGLMEDGRYSPRSGSSTPTSDSESSIVSCSDLVAALEALTIELQQKKQDNDEQQPEDMCENHDEVVPPPEEFAASGHDNKTLTRNDSSVITLGRMSPVKSLGGDSGKVKINDIAEKEKILNECKTQIKTLTANNKLLERKLAETEQERKYALAYRTPCRENLKCWPRARGCIQDLEKKMSFTDDYVEASEIIGVLLESERRYVTSLTLLNSHYQQPMRMLSSFKPEILSMQQLNSLFLNCTELLVLHRVFYEDLLQVPLLAESAQVDKLFEILENTFPAFGHYSSYMAGNRQQSIQKELRQLKTKPQFDQLIKHCQQNCEGTSLTTLLNMPTERLSDYSELLTNFLNPRVRALPEDASKRAEALIRFLRNLRYDLSEEKSDWDYTLEKIKLLNKLATDGPIPLEIFNSDVRLVKQGPLTQVVGKKEMAKHCILFNNYIALAQAKDNQYRIVENGMTPLYGAVLHKCVDVEGQAIGSDLQSGRSEDKLAFGLSLVNNDSLYLRAARPNEWKQWVELLEKSIQESQKLRLELEMDTLDHRPLFPVDSGPKIAAASLEKLFQQLTSPHFEQQDFMRVFLLTHSCFTTAKEVLIALLNCVKSPEDGSDTISQLSESDLFLFMPMEEMSGSGSDCVSASPSMYTINTDSEIGSPGHSPSIVRRSASSTHAPSVMSSSPSPNSLLMTGSSSARKAVHSAASFVSTDSDISPHTSAIVVDNAPVPTKDGWAEAAGDLQDSRKRVVPGKLGYTNLSPSGSPGESEYYSKLCPTNRVCVAESEASDGEMEGVEKTIPTMNFPTRRKARRSLSEGGDASMRLLHSPTEEDEMTLHSHLQEINHSERMQQELDEASKTLAQLTESLDTEFIRNSVVEAAGDVTRRSRTLSSKAMNRLGISSTLSTSEPDLPMCGIEEDDTPPPLPPRDPDMLQSAKAEDAASLSSYRSQRLIRRGSEHSLLGCSLNIGSSGTMEKQPFKSRTLEKANKPKKKSGKKADTFSGRATPNTTPNSLHASPNRTMYFSSSPSHSINLSAAAAFANQDANKTPKKSSKWTNLRMKMNKKFSRSPSVSADTGDDTKLRTKPHRSHSIPAIKKSGVYPGRNASISGGDDVSLSMADGGSISAGHTRHRKTSSSQANNVNLVAKIFSVLSCWVEEYFEDFEADEELTTILSEFLETLVNKGSSDTLEYHRAHQLLQSLQRKRQYTSTPAPHCPFPILLSRVTRLTPEALSMYNWKTPDRLTRGREVDLGKSLNSMCLKMMAEQLTLMEFSVYTVIQRKELLNCNWKKPDKEKLSPNVCRLIRRTNDMTSWVSTEILERQTPSQRAMVIENFIQVANHCHKHNDLHCSLNIIIALGSACIKSLRQTWNEVDKKYRHRFVKLKDSMDYHGKCKKMRENLEQLTQDSFNKTGEIPPALPYIGAYLDIIYTLEMQFKTYNQDGLVNFAKMTKLADMITKVLQYQDVGFKFEPKPEVMAYVTAAKRLSENELYDLSMTAEPPSN